MTLQTYRLVWIGLLVNTILQRVLGRNYNNLCMKKSGLYCGFRLILLKKDKIRLLTP